MLRAQLTSRPRDLELVTRHFQRDDNTIPPTYVLRPPGSLVAPGPEEATLTSVLRGGAQEAWRLGHISQEQWMCYHRSGKTQGTFRGSWNTGHPSQHVPHDLKCKSISSQSTLTLLGSQETAQPWPMLVSRTLFQTPGSALCLPG